MLWYYVAPFVDDKWNILFEDQPRPYVYDSQEEALKAAHEAARSYTKKHKAPSGVRTREGDRCRDDGTYGED